MLFLGDIIVLFSALYITLALRYQTVPHTDVIEKHLGPFALLILIWLLVFFILGLYDRFVLFSRKDLPGKIIRAQLINMLLAVMLFFIVPFGITPKTNLAIYLVVSVLLVTVWRLFIFPRFAPSHSLHVLVIGSGSEARDVTNVLQQNPYFQQVAVDFIDTTEYSDPAAVVPALTAYTKRRQIDVVIADMSEYLSSVLTPLFFKLTFLERRARFYSLTEFYERLHHRIPPSLIGEEWLLQNVTSQSPHYAYDIVKRTIDIIGALMLLVPCIILFPIVIIALKLQDGGSIFYRTIRIGQYNLPIHIYKFRTMNGCDSGTEALQSQLHVTKLGMILRKLRIDELPQLWNVLKGDLSFIGPRPEIPELAAVYAEKIPYYNMRHLIKPGLSGWAQINNYDVPRQGVDVERTIAKLSFDLFYLRHRSVLLDMEIALKTINTVLSRTGT